ncbi:MAG TPA: SpoIID/LytB domain-containing protein [Pyrinomonadaceae bacterium]|jgi:SpoIID/LytB domain protein
MLIRRDTRLLRPRSLLLLLAICASVAVVTFASFSGREAFNEVPLLGGGGLSADAEIDAALERAARGALGEAEGTVVVMDPQTGRLRAVVNPRAAFDEASAPGSAVKPFTALAALRRRLIDERTRRLCRTRYAYKELAISCAHQRTEVSFNLAQALAYSCNYFFGKVGERLDTDAFDETLREFGFGARTGAGKEDEEAGSLPQGEWRVSYAIGESAGLTVTPVQLITAYSALVNGGRLFVPRQAAPGNFQTIERARLTVAPEHRAAILEGMRGAVRFGTASGAGLNSLPFEVFGKTGTSTMANDYRSQGWFVGFAAERGAGRDVPPESVRLGVLVFLKHSHGADSARVARSVFEEYAKLSGGDFVKGEEPAGEEGARASGPLSAVPVRVHLTGKSITRELALEEYVLGVVAAEGSVEDELEGLKALAVAARTYALKNLRRHADEGYDFCDTTHCQRYLLAVADERSHARFKNLFRRAVTETAGETLRDGEGRVADAYFHAACGGMTADVETLWGVTDAPGHLRGVSDEYCAATPHLWVNVIPAAKLAKALRGDSMSDVGERLYSVTVKGRDRTGRVEYISLEGEGRRELRGWDFKMIVGRALGWNVLKSSRFEVTREGSDFVFRGSGFGHGLGLCQEGAHEMARRGLSYRRILEHYFPGTKMGE